MSKNSGKYVRVKTPSGGYFNILREDYNRVLEEQGGVCAICKEPEPQSRRLAVDHCHNTNIIRGILCMRCNTNLGWTERYYDIIDDYLNRDAGIYSVARMSMEDWYRRGKNTCKHVECDNFTVSHGWCQKHWYRVKNYGSPDKLVKPGNKFKTLGN